MVKISNMENQTMLPSPTEDVLTDHIREVRQIEREGYELGVKRGRNALFWIAGLMVVADMLIAYGKDELNLALVGLVAGIASIFTGLGFLTRKKPYIALLSGMVLYIGLWATDLVFSLRAGSFNGTTAFSGLIVRIVFVIFLARALPDARKLERILRELPS
jgi:hypothetical protein